MDRLDKLQQAIKQVLESYAALGQDNSDVETELIFDTQGHHYQLLHVGWQGNRRIYGCVVHMDIKNDKIWLQHNGTESDIAEELVELGISKHEIVIGFHSPFKRKFTDYAVC